jgi:hypothetical protein
MNCRLYKSGHHYNRLNDNQLYCRCGEIQHVTYMPWRWSWPYWQQPAYFTYTANTSAAPTWQLMSGTAHTTNVLGHATFTTWSDVQKAVSDVQKAVSDEQEDN